MDINTDFISRVEQEAKRIEEDCVYNSTGNFIAAKRWKILEYGLNCPAALLTGLAAFFAFTHHTILAGILTVTATLLNIAQILLVPGNKSHQYKAQGEKYLALRNRVRLFRTVELPDSNRNTGELSKEIASYSEKKNEINMDSLQLPDWAYLKAKVRVEQGRSDYDIDTRERKFLQTRMRGS